MVSVHFGTKVDGWTSLRSYLFDIFLGGSYNQTPPSVKYMTVSLSLLHVLP
jgi:hypothetical protein